MTKVYNKFSCLIKTIFSFILTIISLFGALISTWANFTWDNLDFEKIQNNLNISLDKIDIFTFDPTLKYYFALFVILGLTLLCIFNNRNLLKISIFFSIIFIYNIHIIPYYYNQFHTTELYEKYYQIPEITAKDFPDQKRNLLLIYLESIEKNFTNQNLYERNLLPKLDKLTQNNPHFNNYYSLYGTDYTKGALVAGHCGVPNRNPNPKKISYHFNNLTCISDILAKNGYETWFAKSADHSFALTNIFYLNHNYKNIINRTTLTQDLTEAEINKNKSSYNGLSDKLLFQNILTQFQNKSIKEPFLLTTFTVDTHFPDTILPYNCPKIYGDMRDNIMCTDNNVANFLKEFQKTPYWKNTSIVILGDHFMFSELPVHNNQKYKRSIYNVFLNIPDHLHYNSEKQFTALDFAPTYLEAIDVKLPEHAFGLGRSLFSDIPSLISLKESNLAQAVKQNSVLANTFHELNTNIKYNDYTFGKHLTNQTSIAYTPIYNELINKNFINLLALKLSHLPKKDLILKLKFEAMQTTKPKLIINLNQKPFKTISFTPKIGANTLELTIPHQLITSKNILFEFINNNYGTFISQSIAVKDFQLEETK